MPDTPPLSFAFSRFASFVASTAPLLPLNKALGLIVHRLVRKHPDVMDRLAPIAGTRFLITASDIGLSFLVLIQAQTIQAQAVRGRTPVDVSVKGPIRQLVALLEGDLDGDALFFSRDLVIEGDTELLLTLRNAVDSANIELQREIPLLFAPFDQAAATVFTTANSAFHRAEQEAIILQQGLLDGVTRRVDTLARDMAQQQQAVRALTQSVDRIKRRKSKTGTDKPAAMEHIL